MLGGELEPCNSQVMLVREDHLIDWEMSRHDDRWYPLRVVGGGVVLLSMPVDILQAVATQDPCGSWGEVDC